MTNVLVVVVVAVPSLLDCFIYAGAFSFAPVNSVENNFPA